MRKTTIRLSDPVRDVLERSIITADTLQLPGQLDRKLYQDTMKVIDLAGGRWIKKEKLHRFPSDPRELLGLALQTGSVSAERKPVQHIDDGNGGKVAIHASQFFPTPRRLAMQIAEVADILPGHRLLEPSGGNGALLDGVREECGFFPQEIVVVEIDDALKNHLRRYLDRNPSLQDFAVYLGDFLTFVPDQPNMAGGFDRIIMNPPFVDGLDVDHIRHAFQFLRPGGRLVGICANGSRQQQRLKPWLEALGGTYEPLPPGSFKESGTNVNAAIVTVDL